MLPNPMEDIARRLVNYEKRLSHLERLEGGEYTEGARVYRDSNQSIPTAAYTPIVFNQEDYDTDDIFDAVANPTRLTCKTPGKYQISISIAFGPTNVGYSSAFIKLNNLLWIGRGNVKNSAGVWATPSDSSTYHLALDDYIECLAYHTRGANNNVIYSPHYTCYFMMQRIG